MRIVSLLPAATETVYALGLEPVGTSHACDWPPAATEVPAVVRSRVDGDADPASINEQVAAAEDDHGGVYDLDDEYLRALEPDLVITQAMCDVCAVDSRLVADAVDDLGLGAEVLTLDPHRLDDVLGDINRIGTATGEETAAEALVASLESRIEAVETATAGADRRPRTAVLDWTDPVMVAGHWVPDLIELAGGSSGLVDPGGRSRPWEWSTIAEYDPEVLVVAPCGFDLEQAAEAVDYLVDRPGWGGLAAVEAGRVSVMDGRHHLNRPGPRLVDSLEHLAGLFHPDRVDAPPTDAAGTLETMVQ